MMCVPKPWAVVFHSEWVSIEVSPGESTCTPLCSPVLWWPTPTQTGSLTGSLCCWESWCSLMHAYLLCPHAYMHRVHARFTLCGPLNLLWLALDYWGCTHLAPDLASAWKNYILLYRKWTRTVNIMSLIGLMLSEFVSKKVLYTLVKVE